MRKKIQKIVIANWKMNPRASEKAAELLRKISSVAKKVRKAKIVVAPPFIYLPVLKNVGGIDLGAQDVFWKNEGAYTGEISPRMLKNSGVHYVIVGHSERREHLGETDEMINKKLKAALASGLKVILCVGEKDRNSPDFQNFVREELRADLKDVSGRLTKNLLIAYEPLWAIGTGNAAEPDDILEMATFIRRQLFDIVGQKAAYETPILYGGSVDYKNAASFLYAKGVNGLLVGSASLLPEEFIKIVLAANESR